MLSLKGIHNASEFSQRLHHGEDQAFRFDYELPPGRWLGRGATALGLDNGLGGMISPPQWHDLLAEITRQPPETRAAHPGWDLIVEAPPGVSALFALGNSQAREFLVEMHHRAVEHTLECLEEVTAISQTPAGLVAAGFTHDTTDAYNPDLHDHLVIFNVSPIPALPGTILEEAVLSQYLPALNAIYHYELDALLVNVLGLATERQGESFAISGIPERILQELTTPREESSRFLQGFAHRVVGVVNRIADALYPDRHGKTELPERYARWAAVGRDYGFTHDDVFGLMRLNAPSPEMAAEWLRNHPHLEDLGWRGDYVLLDATEQGRFNTALHRTVSRAVQEYPSLSETHLLRALAEECRELHLGPLPVWTTVQEFLGKEPALRESAPPGQTAPARETWSAMPQELGPGEHASRNDHPVVRLAGSGALAAAGISLNIEEVAALTRLVEAPGRLQVLDGFSHDRMTQILQAASLHWTCTPGGYTVIGTSAIPGFEQDLQAHTGIRSIPLDRILWPAPGRERIPAGKTILLVEEIERCSVRILTRLLERAEEAGATLVLAIARVLDPMQPPQEPTGRHEGGERSSTDGLPQTAANARALAHLIRQWEHEGIADPHSHVILAGSREEVAELNRLAQAKRRDAGALGAAYVMVNGTPFYTNDRVVFTEEFPATPDIFPGTTGTVRAALPALNCLLIETDNGRMRLVLAHEFRGLALGYALPMQYDPSLQAPKTHTSPEGPKQNTRTHAAEARTHQEEEPYALESEPELEDEHDLSIDR